MGSESPNTTPTLRRNGYSFDKLTSMIGLGNHHQTAAILDFAGESDDLGHTDWSDGLTMKNVKPGLGHMNGPSTDSISSVGTTESEAVPSNPRMRRISAPAMKYGQGIPDPSKLEIPAEKKERRVSHGDRANPSNYGMIMKWLAFNPNNPRISEETDGPALGGVLPQSPAATPITDAARTLNTPPAMGVKRVRNKPSREWNAIAPSNW